MKIEFLLNRMKPISNRDSVSAGRNSLDIKYSFAEYVVYMAIRTIHAVPIGNPT